MMEMSASLSSFLTAQRALINEKLFIQEDISELQSLRDRLSNLQSCTPLLAVQVRELELNVDRFRNGECTLDGAYDTVAALSKASDLFKRRTNDVERFLHHLFFNPSDLASSIAFHLFHDKSSSSSALRRCANDLSRFVLHGLYANVSDPICEGNLLAFFKASMKHAFQFCQSPNELFEIAFFKKVFPAYARRIGREYAGLVLRDTLRTVLDHDDFDVSLDLDRMDIACKIIGHSKDERKVPVAQQKTLTPSGKQAPLQNLSGISDDDVRKQLQKNQANLYRVCTRIVSSLTQSVNCLPFGIRMLACEIVDCAKEAFPNSSTQEFASCLFSFFFMQYINLCIIDPERYGLVRGAPVSEKDREKLTVIANVLRHMAFGIPFQEKNSYSGMNIFISQNGEAMHRYFESIIAFRHSSSFAASEASEDVVSKFHMDTVSSVVVTFNEVSLLHRCASSVPLEHCSAEFAVAIAALGDGFEAVDPSEDRYVFVGSAGSRHSDIDVALSSTAASIPTSLPSELRLPFSQLKSVLTVLPSAVPLIPVVPIDKASAKDKKDMNMDADVDVDSVLFFSVLRQWADKEAGNKQLVRAACLLQCLRSLEDVCKRLGKKMLFVLFDAIIAESTARKQHIASVVAVEKARLLQMGDILSRLSSGCEDEHRYLLAFLSCERLRMLFSSMVIPQLRTFLSDDCTHPQTIRTRFSRFLLDLLGHARSLLVKSRFTASEVDASLDVIEKFCVMHFFESSFASFLLSEKDREKDRNLSMKLASLHGILPEDMDLPLRYCSATTWALLLEELSNWSNFRNPLERIESMVLISKSVFEIMKFCSDVESSLDSRILPAMDDFLPILIYLLIRANPSSLHSSVVQMSDCLNLHADDQKAYLFSDKKDYTAEYWFPHFEAAVMYLAELDPSELLKDIQERKASKVQFQISPATITSGSPVPGTDTQKGSVSPRTRPSTHARMRALSRRMSTFHMSMSSAASPADVKSPLFEVAAHVAALAAASPGKRSPERMSSQPVFDGDNALGSP
eukprot:ANDGO_02368.mRNA.1 Ras GTPase-activating-like protein gapA